MKTTIYYDYICPFCYLGSKRMETLVKEFDLDIEWKGFEIHPEFPPQGVKRSKTLKGRQIAQDIAMIAKEEDMQIKLPGILTNSRPSLEASEFAKSKNKFDEFHLSVYEAYFQNGENIGDKNVILKIGERVGLPTDELEECLKERTMRKKIEENRREAEDNLVLGVPTFIFGGGFPVYGIQSLESMRKIISRAIERS